MNSATPSSGQVTDTDTGSEVLALSLCEPISQGRRQFIFEHPNDPSVVVKVQKPSKIKDEDRYRSRRVLDRIRYGEGFTDFLREFREYIELRTHFPQDPGDLPVCAVRGIIDTDLGVGLVYERISEPDGNMSPTLGALVKGKLTAQEHLDALTRHFNAMSEMRVVVSNFNLLNLVYQTRENQIGRFVWIDSTGCKQTIPTRRWFKKLNDRKLRKIEAHFRAAILASLERD